MEEEVQMYRLHNSAHAKKISLSESLACRSGDRSQRCLPIVARGDLQPMNNEEVYASTLALKTFRILLAIICHFDWITLQLDAVNAIVHSCPRRGQARHSGCFTE